MLDVFEVFYVGRMKFVIGILRDSFEESSESRNIYSWGQAFRVDLYLMI